ncbi:hypothetical protein D3C87_1423290 [compost metagenome]
MDGGLTGITSPSRQVENSRLALVIRSSALSPLPRSWKLFSVMNSVPALDLFWESIRL